MQPRVRSHKAAFQDFEPFWEFVLGPIYAGTFGPKPTREFPRLCRGGSKSLTYPEVGSLGPWTGLQTVSRQAHERSPANG